MGRRWYVMVGGVKHYGSEAACRAAVQRAANMTGKRAALGYDLPRRPKATARHMTANPLNPHLKTAGTELLSFLRGRDITADQARRIKAIAKAKPRKAGAARPLPKASKSAKRSPSKDGAAARRAGLYRSDNPYEPGTMGHRLWLNGFER